MKKIISLTLALVLIIGTLCVFPVGVSAKAKTYMGFEYYELSDGGIRIVGCDDDRNGTVTIPETIKGKKVVSILQFSTLVNDKTTKLVIPRYVKEITYAYHSPGRSGMKYSVAKANKTFCSYKGMLMTKSKKTLYAMPYTDKETVTVPSTVVNIRARAFHDFAGGDRKKNLTINLPKGLKKIGAEAFTDIDDLHSIKLPSGLESIGKYAFRGSLINYDDPRKETNSKYLVKVKIPASVTSIAKGAVGYGDHGRLRSCLIKGAKGSAAETYANSNGFEFQEVN